MRFWHSSEDLHLVRLLEPYAGLVESLEKVIGNRFSGLFELYLTGTVMSTFFCLGGKAKCRPCLWFSKNVDILILVIVAADCQSRGVS